MYDTNEDYLGRNYLDRNKSPLREGDWVRAWAHGQTPVQGKTRIQELRENGMLLLDPPVMHLGPHSLWRARYCELAPPVEISWIPMSNL